MGSQSKRDQKRILVSFTSLTFLAVNKGKVFCHSQKGFSFLIGYKFQITGGACGLVLTANAIMFLTILGFFIAFDGDDVQYSVW